jgi:hypothetical protein
MSQLIIGKHLAEIDVRIRARLNMAVSESILQMQCDF